MQNNVQQIRHNTDVFCNIFLNTPRVMERLETLTKEQALSRFKKELAIEILLCITSQNMPVLATRLEPQLELTTEELCEEFYQRVGVELEDFVGLEGNQFLRSSHIFYLAKVYARRFEPIGEIAISELVRSKLRRHLRIHIDKYREMLLIQAWKLIEIYGPPNACCKNTGNSALHFLVGTPGEGTASLVRLLFKAGGQNLALKLNNKGENILHIIAGSMRAEERSNGDFVFRNQKPFEEQDWDAKERKAVLDVLTQELSSDDLFLLARDQEKLGDAPLHKWALAVSTRSKYFNESFFGGEREIGLWLIRFGAQLRLANYRGHVPLHYAFNTEVFEFLVKHYGVCHVRNDQDETPLMFMIKTIIKEALSEDIERYPELTAQCLQTKSQESVNVKRLTDVLELVEKSHVSEKIKNTIAMPDIHGNSILYIIVSSISIASYELYERTTEQKDVINQFRKDLVSLLEKVIPIHYSTGRQRDEQNPLHTLLDIRLDLDDFFKCDDDTVLNSLDILLQQGVEVNGEDEDGQTPLDMAYEQYHSQPSLYSKIIKKLVQHGAQQSAQSCERKIKSGCPKIHLKKATKLAKTKNTKSCVRIVGQYRYFNSEPIGSGAFSSVYVAIKDEHQDDQSGTILCSVFALKRIEKAKVNPKEVKNEVKTLMTLSDGCKNIIKYHDSLQDENFIYLCVDLLDGDLEMFVNSNVLQSNGQEQLMKGAASIINGLEYLHEKSFIHRDLKPGNILYTTEPVLNFKIADFGLTKNMAGSTLSTVMSTIGGSVAMAPGTRCWKAPELVSMKSREHTKQSDIFSLGLVLHYLLTLGKHPFAIGNEEPAYVIERRIVDSEIQFGRGLDREARSFLQQVLNQNPSKRPPAQCMHQHPFLWNDGKKTEFLKAVGAQPEAVNPSKDSKLEWALQETAFGKHLQTFPWNRCVPELLRNSKRKKYKKNKVIDLLRFIRNVYAHLDERSEEEQRQLDENIFLRAFPSLVLDVFVVVQQLNYEKRINIRRVLEMK